MKKFENKNCFITGAASGIGRSFALALAKKGMNLFITDINMENLENVRQEIENLGTNVYTGKCDVSKFEDFEKMAKEFYSKLGNVDLLINNAGIAIGGDLIELELKDWKEVLDVNLWSVIYSIKTFLPSMLERGSGHIVNVASGAGIFGSTEPLPYIASKFAVVGISEGLFGQLYNQGIQVSVIIPSYVKTNIFSVSKMKYSKKFVEELGEEKLDAIFRDRAQKMLHNAILPDKAVGKYIEGIKNNQLYIFDKRNILPIFILKGKDPQQFEKFLINYYDNYIKTTKEFFLKFGINIDDYK
ncbi:MAG: SDR family NAD(P)-dependent oxidoreductase [Promethearchaeota archaeon]